MYVAYKTLDTVYPNKKFLFRPDTKYPEYPFDSLLSKEPNSIYFAFREMLCLAKLDEDNYGKTNWNPLGVYISPGDTILIKPNLVMHKNLSRNTESTIPLFTHPSVIASVIDYVWIALKGNGRILLADAPMQSCDFDLLVAESGIKALIDFYQSKEVSIELKDLRGLVSHYDGSALVQDLSSTTEGIIVDLGCHSAFNDLSKERLDSLRIADYDPFELKKHHNGSVHEYCIAKDVLNADVVIDMPKFKTHEKAGITGALKNLVGINVRKEYLPHHSNGVKADGFDEHEHRGHFKNVSLSLLDKRNSSLDSNNHISQNVLHLLTKVFAKTHSVMTGEKYSFGSWYGNDTIWRMVKDLNVICAYCNKDGLLFKIPQRRIIAIGDGVVGGQGRGPLSPDPAPLGILAIADNPVVHDIAMARLMDTDSSRIPTINNAIATCDSYPLWNGVMPTCVSNSEDYDGLAIDMLVNNRQFKIEPSPGWVDNYYRSGE